MITIKQWMELVDYKITEGSDYGWNCYGKNSYCLSSSGQNGIHDKGGYSVNILFSTKSQKVYEVDIHDYTNDRAYRMQHPDYVKKYNKEAKSRDVIENQAWDDVKFIDLTVEDDWLEKSRRIISGQDYSTSIAVPIEFTDEEMLRYMTAAHEADVSFNTYVNRVLEYAISSHAQSVPGVDESEPSHGYRMSPDLPLDEQGDLFSSESDGHSDR